MIALIQSQLFILTGLSCSGKHTSSSQQQTDGVKPPQPGLTPSQEDESACWRASNTTFIVPHRKHFPLTWWGPEDGRERVARSHSGGCLTLFGWVSEPSPSHQ